MSHQNCGEVENEECENDDSASNIENFEAGSGEEDGNEKDDGDSAEEVDEDERYLEESGNSNGDEDGNGRR